MGTKTRLALILLLLVLSIVAESAIYVVAAAIHAVFACAIIYFAWPLAKRLLSNND